MSRIRALWRQPDQFDTMTAFLRQRGLIRQAQQIMAVVAGSSALVPLTALAFEQQSPVQSTLIGATTAVFIVALTAFWLTRWPTCQQSRAAVLVGACCIAAWSLVQPSATIAILVSAAFAASGGYIAFFHNARVLLFNTGLTVVAVTNAVVKLAGETDVGTAVAAFWVVFFLNVSVPMTIWSLSRAMGTYAGRADADPLTGLLNRRGFIDVVINCLGSPAPGHRHLTLFLIDLDEFKRVNDTHGHATGDQVLVDVARLLRRHCPPGAAICRSGGEEFLIALQSGRLSDSTRLATLLCNAIASLPHQVTASVGAASSALSDVIEAPDQVEKLISAADLAMYAAKRRGGNQTEHC